MTFSLRANEQNIIRLNQIIAREYYDSATTSFRAKHENSPVEQINSMKCMPNLIRKNLNISSDDIDNREDDKNVYFSFDCAPAAFDLK